MKDKTKIEKPTRQIRKGGGNERVSFFCQLNYVQGKEIINKEKYEYII